MYTHYITVDDKDRIIDGFSDAFRKPYPTDICLCKSNERQFELLKEKNPVLVDDQGCHLYKYTKTTTANGTSVREVKRCSADDILEEKNDKLDIFKSIKKAELKRDLARTTDYGVDIQTSTGKEHFSLTTRKNLELSTLYSQMILTNASSVKYYSDDGNCRYYSREEFTTIALTAQKFVTDQTTLCNTLIDYVNMCTSYTELEKISFTIDCLPDDLRTKYLSDIHV